MTLPANFIKETKMLLPAFKQRDELVVDLSKIKEAESRVCEARVVNGSTYNDLEYCFNEGYREARDNIAAIGYEIALAEKEQLSIKSQALIDDYSEFLKEKKLKDSAAIREAFLETKIDYVETRDRIDMLTALRVLLEGKVKNFENVCRYMRKQIDLEIRSGVFNDNKYL